MKRIPPFLRVYFGILFFLLLPQFSFAQIPSFLLSLTSTNETCENNGTLSFMATETAPGASILYSVYLLSNTTSAIGVTAGNTYSGLSSGTYRVVATQSLGTESNSQQKDIIVSDQVTQLEYSMVGESHLCDNKITVTINQGTAVAYEIISGPVLKPLQASNVFTGLIPGLYLIRVFDIVVMGLHKILHL